MVNNRHLPPDMSLLRLQHEHITKDLWEGNERVLRPRRAGVWILNNQDLIDPRVKFLMELAGFGDAYSRHGCQPPSNHFLIRKVEDKNSYIPLSTWRDHYDIRGCGSPPWPTDRWKCGHRSHHRARHILDVPRTSGDNFTTDGDKRKLN